MDLIDIPLEERTQREGLRLFLESCRDEAEADQHPKLASIALAVRHVDPLAVLDSIYEAGADHYYMENPYRERAIAGAEAVLKKTFSGARRFEEMKAFAQQWEPHIIAIGDASLPIAGPLVFAGLTFFAEPQGSPFDSATAFVPCWQVARFGNVYAAGANALIEPGCSVEPIVERIWAAHQTFSSGAYDQPRPAPGYRILEEAEVGPPGAFEAAVERALSAIEAGRYEKIVLSRAVDLLFDNPCEPLRILDRLRSAYPSCHLFSFQNALGASLMGATPERLVSVSAGHFETEALAGSAPRGQTAGEDAALARALLGSEKDQREHRHVVESIRRRLEGLGLETVHPGAARLLSLPNVHHLQTPISGVMQPGQHVLDLAQCLHPTPAVGGTPREAALEDIRRWEPFDRGLFAGLNGWFDFRGNGEFLVGIRSAQVRDSRARLFAGAGIVSGSVPAREREETAVKMAALLQAIRGGAQ
jgi:menaquinone-specific isochorismate synthase